jgi:hypothetical protein
MVCGALALLAILLLPLQESKAFARRECSQQPAAPERKPVANEQAPCVSRKPLRAPFPIDELRDLQKALDQPDLQLSEQLNAFSRKWGSWDPAKLELTRIRTEQALCVTRDPVRVAFLVAYLQDLDRAQEQLKPLRATFFRLLWIWGVVDMCLEWALKLNDKGVVQGSIFMIRTEWKVWARSLNVLRERSPSRRP